MTSVDEESNNYSGWLSIKEFEISLNEPPENVEKLRHIFEQLSFSFYAHFKPTDEKNRTNVKDDLQAFFGTTNVLECRNRIDSKVVDCSTSIIDDCFLNADLNNHETWINLENLIGCLINNIDLY